MWRYAKATVLTFATLACLAQSLGLETPCLENEHCHTGYYCNSSKQQCQQCVECGELNRRPPPTSSPTPCAKSVTECGFCLDGLSLNADGDRCVRETAPFPVWWVAGGCALLAALLVICAVAIHLLWHPTIKIFACTTTKTVESLSGSGALAVCRAPPPSYSAAMALPPPDKCEELALFIEPAPETSPGLSRAEKQTARVHNLPIYARPPEPPSYEYEIPSMEEPLPSEPEAAINSNDQHGGQRDRAPENHSTFPSLTHVEVYPAIEKQVAETPTLKIDQNSNMKDSAGASAGSRQPSFSLAGDGTAFIINVIKNVHTVSQQNVAF